MRNLKIKLAAHAGSFILLTACTSTLDYQVAIPIATSQVLDEMRMGDDRFEIRYRVGAGDQRIFRVVPSEGNYTGSDRESLGAIREEAIQRMIRQAIDKVNGVFITAKTEVAQVSFSRGQLSTTYEDFKDEMVSKVAGFAKVEGTPQCWRTNLDGGATRVSCSGRVRVPEVDVVKTSF